MRLAINIDHVATLRQARGGSEPDPVSAAHLCELAGAEGIVCHLREDRRHVNDRDLRVLRETVQTRLDLEMAATNEIIAIALKTKPELATLVPERREEKTTEGGLNVRADRAHLEEAIKSLHGGGIPVSLFVEPDRSQIETAKEIGSDVIEIHTGHYADARAERAIHEHLVRIQTAATFAKSLGLGVNAGHGLNYVNTEAIVAIKDIDELSIGHAIISRAVHVGLPEAVREMLRIVKGR